MADAIEFTVRGLDEVTKHFEQLLATLPQEVEKFVVEVATDVVSKAIPNAPILTGDLRSSLKVTAVKKSATTIAVQVVSDLSYASLMHRFLVPFGTPLGTSFFTGKPIYSRQAKSLAQPTTPEGGTGGEFVTRAAFNNVARYETLLSSVITRIVFGGSVSGPAVTTAP